MFTKLLREEPEVLALAAIVMMAVMAPQVPRGVPLRWPGPPAQLELDGLVDMEGLAPRDFVLPRIEFIRYR